MSELIITTEVPVEKGFIYFCKADDKGNVEVRRARAGRPRKVEVKEETKI